MRTFGLILLIAVGLAQAATINTKTCLSNTDCSATECCYKKHEFLVVSKRGDTFEGYPTQHQDLAHTHGVCQSYHNEGDACTPFDKANGYCSCNDKAGVSCQYEHQDALLASKRAVMPFARYTCKKTTN